MVGEGESVGTDRVPHRAACSDPGPGLKILVLSEIRFLGEGLTQALWGASGVSLLEYCADLGQAFQRIPAMHPEIVLLDASFSGGPPTVDAILGIAPQLRVVVFAIAEAAND